MTTDEQIVKKIRETASSVRTAFMADNQFWAVAAMHLDVFPIAPSQFDRMGIQIAATDTRKIYLTEKWLDLPGRQKLGVFAHEICHCLLLHIPRGIGKPDGDLWNVAIDHATNLILIDSGFELPKYAHADSSFQGMDAETIYKHLAEMRDTGKLEVEQTGFSPDDDMESSESDSSENGTRAGNGKTDDNEPGDDIEDGNEESALPVLGRDIAYDDIMGQGGKASTGPPQSDKPIELNYDGGYIDSEVREAIDTWMNIAASALKAGKMAGNVPSGMEQFIQRAARPRISLKRHLQKFITSRAKTGRNWSKGHRKWLQEDIYLPSRRRPGIKRLMIAIDTSGSIPDDLLTDFLAIVHSVTSFYHATIEVWCVDTKMHRVGVYDEGRPLPKKIIIKGRGGTSFFEPIQMAEKLARFEPSKKFDAIVYLTDGMGSYSPKTSFTPPVIWVMCEEHPPSSQWYPPYGKVCMLYD